MERKELLEANGAIFTAQGKALAAGAADDVRVLVVGNPANTNCLIAMNNAELDPARAVHRDDPARPQPRQGAARGQGRTRRSRRSRSMTIWGNHSATQYPDVFHAQVDGKPASDLVDQAWIEKEFIPTVQQRGAAVIEARGASSAASAANAALDHVRDWALGTADGDWVSMAVLLRRLLRRARGPDLGLPVHDQERRVVDRARPRHRRLLARPHRRDRSPSSAKSATRSPSSA